MKKVFISQPMKGLAKEEILDLRNKIVEFLEEDLFDKDNIEFLDTVFEFVEGKNH